MPEAGPNSFVLSQKDIQIGLSNTKNSDGHMSFDFSMMKPATFEGHMCSTSGIVESSFIDKKKLQSLISTVFGTNGTISIPCRKGSSLSLVPTSFNFNGQDIALDGKSIFKDRSVMSTVLIYNMDAKTDGSPESLLVTITNTKTNETMALTRDVTNEVGSQFVLKVKTQAGDDYTCMNPN